MNTCPKCNKPLVCENDGTDLIEKQRRDKTGSFWACSRYPECTFIHKEPRSSRPAPSGDYRELAQAIAQAIKELIEAIRTSPR